MQMAGPNKKIDQELVTFFSPFFAGNIDTKICSSCAHIHPFLFLVDVCVNASRPRCML